MLCTCGNIHKLKWVYEMCLFVQKAIIEEKLNKLTKGGIGKHE